MNQTINDTGIKRAALINDLSCIGKCSLSVALPIVSACGVEAVALPTAVLSTHTGGFEGYVVRDMTEEMRSFAAHWKQMGVHFDCIYTGFFGSLRQISLAEQFIREFADSKTLILVDPVLGDNGKIYGCFSDAYVIAMRRLCSLAHVITPNPTEAALLTGSAMDTPAEELLEKMSTPSAILTGVRRGDEIGYLARLGEEQVEIFKRFVPVSLHGTGDVFASALCGELLGENSQREALQKAADFCDECIRETEARLPGHWYGLAFEPVLNRRMARK